MKFTENCDSSTVRGQGSSFGDTLRELKNQGCSVLLCGIVSDDVREQTSARLLGKKTASVDRTCLFVTTNQNFQSVHTRLALADIPVQSARVIWMENTLRSAAANTVDSYPFQATHVSSDIKSLEQLVRHTIAALERDHGGFAPAQLRVCVDTLPSLIIDEDNKSVEAFLDTLDQMAAATRGMVHCILPFAYDASVVERFIPYFDITISLRPTNQGATQQQWYLPVMNYRTDWFPVECAVTSDADPEDEPDTE